MREDLENLVNAYVDFLNEGNLDRLRPLLDPQVEYRGFGDRARSTGIESFLATVAYVRAADPGTRGELTDAILDADANTAVAFITLTRSDPELPPMELITVFSVSGGEGEGEVPRIVRMAERHVFLAKDWRDPCLSWQLPAVPVE